MEIRGLGVVDVERALRHARHARRAPDRPRRRADRVERRAPIASGSTIAAYTLLDVALPLVRIPVTAGRNLGLLIETAARNQLLRWRGRAQRRGVRRRGSTTGRPAAVVTGPGTMSQPLRAVVVTGLSGSGKSTALNVLEDLGFYCIDNLPVALMPRFLELWQSSREDVGRVALGIDVRERRFPHDVPARVRRAARRGRRARGDLPRGQRRRAGAPLQRDAPAASGGRRRRPSPTASGASATRCATCASWPIASSTPARFTVHELRAALRELLETPDAGTHDDVAASRSATSTVCRPTPTSRSTAASCRTRSSSRSCGRRPAPTRTSRPTCSSARRAGAPRARDGAAATSRCRATSARARAISPSPSAAPAAGIARSCWWRSCAQRLAGRGYRVLVRHRDVER